MQLYTRKGDKGETELFGGDKISKDDARVWCYGTVDELSAYLGVIRASCGDNNIKEIILNIQNKLLTIGSQLASNDNMKVLIKNKINEQDVVYLENKIDEYSALVGELTSFVLAGESQLSAHMHVARTVARRCERIMVNLNKIQQIDDFLLIYVNRLSDLLFALALFTETK